MEKPCENCGAIGAFTFDEFAASVVCQSCGKVVAGTDEWELTADATFEGASYTGVHYDRVSTCTVAPGEGPLADGGQNYKDAQRSARLEMGFLETIAACCAYLRLPPEVERQAGDVMRWGLKWNRLLSLGSRWGRLHKLQAAACVYISVRMNAAAASCTLTEVAAAVNEGCFALGAVFKKLRSALRLKLEIVHPTTCLPRAATQFPCLQGLPHKTLADIFSAAESVIAIGDQELLIEGKLPLQVATAALAVTVQYCKGLVRIDDLDWMPLVGGFTTARRLTRALQVAMSERAARLPKWDGATAVTFVDARGVLRRDYLNQLVAVRPQDAPSFLAGPHASSSPKPSLPESTKPGCLPPSPDCSSPPHRVDLPDDRCDASGASCSNSTEPILARSSDVPEQARSAPPPPAVTAATGTPADAHTRPGNGVQASSLAAPADGPQPNRGNGTRASQNGAPSSSSVEVLLSRETAPIKPGPQALVCPMQATCPHEQSAGAGRTVAPSGGQGGLGQDTVARSGATAVKALGQDMIIGTAGAEPVTSAGPGRPDVCAGGAPVPPCAATMAPSVATMVSPGNGAPVQGQTTVSGAAAPLVGTTALQGPSPSAVSSVVPSECAGDNPACAAAADTNHGPPGTWRLGGGVPPPASPPSRHVRWTGQNKRRRGPVDRWTSADGDKGDSDMAFRPALQPTNHRMALPCSGGAAAQAQGSEPGVEEPFDEKLVSWSGRGGMVQQGAGSSAGFFSDGQPVFSLMGGRPSGDVDVACMGSWVDTDDVLRVLYQPHEGARKKARAKGGECPIWATATHRRRKSRSSAAARADAAGRQRREPGPDEGVDDGEIDEYICSPVEVLCKMAILKKIEEDNAAE